MKKLKIIVMFLFLIILPLSIQAKEEANTNKFRIDQLSAVIYGADGIEVITGSDIARPSLSGQGRSLDDLIFERLVFLDSKKFKAGGDDEAVDKYLAMIAKENKMTSQDLVKLFHQAGYTYDEGRKQFEYMQGVNSMLDFKVRQNLIVPRKKVEEYYHSHPEFCEPTYMVKRAFIPFNKHETKLALKESLKQYSRQGRGRGDVEWSDSFGLQKNEVPESKSFIFALKKDEISSPQELEDGFEFFKLEEIKKRTLDECYMEIAYILKQPRFEQLLAEYKDDLFKNNAILFFD